MRCEARRGEAREGGRDAARYSIGIAPSRQAGLKGGRGGRMEGGHSLRIPSPTVKRGDGPRGIGPVYVYLLLLLLLYIVLQLACCVIRRVL
jgi:hypothetical protein